MRSSKYFLGGMYILICLRQLVLGQSIFLCICTRCGLLSCETDALNLTKLYHQGTIPNGTRRIPCDLYRLGSYCQAPLINQLKTFTFQHVHAASLQRYLTSTARCLPGHLQVWSCYSRPQPWLVSCWPCSWAIQSGLPSCLHSTHTLPEGSWPCRPKSLRQWPKEASKWHHC